MVKKYTAKSRARAVNRLKRSCILQSKKHRVKYQRRFGVKGLKSLATRSSKYNAALKKVRGPVFGPALRPKKRRGGLRKRVMKKRKRLRQRS